MQIVLGLEQEAQLTAIALQEGKSANELANGVFTRGLAEEAHFLAAVKAGQDAARRGDLVEQQSV
jgi:hypothetical protein